MSENANLPESSIVLSGFQSTHIKYAFSLSTQGEGERERFPRDSYLRAMK